MDEVRKRRPWDENSRATYIQNGVAKAPPAYRELLGDFAQWLENERGLERETVRKRVGEARPILDRLVGDEGTFETSLNGLVGDSSLCQATGS